MDKLTLKWILIIISIVYALLIFNIKPTNKIHVDEYYYTDLAHYYGNAKSLSEGQGYRVYYVPGKPKDRKYPPGLSIFFALFILLLKDTFLVLKIGIFLLYAGSLIVFWAYLDKVFKLWQNGIEPQTLILFIFVIYAFNLNVIELSHSLLSETPYIFSSLMALYFLDCYSDSKEQKYFIGVIISSAFAILFRMIGITLIVAVFIYLALLHRSIKKALCYLFLSLTPIFIYFLYLSTNLFSLDYIKENFETTYFYRLKINFIKTLFLNPFYLIFSNFFKRVEFLKEPLFKVGMSTYASLTWFLSFSIIFLVSSGIVAVVRHKKYIPDTLYFIFYLLIIILYVPGDGDVRLLVPIYPVLLCLFFYGLCSSISSISWFRWVENKFYKKGLMNIKCSVTFLTTLVVVGFNIFWLGTFVGKRISEKASLIKSKKVDMYKMESSIYEPHLAGFIEGFSLLKHSSGDDLACVSDSGKWIEFFFIFTGKACHIINSSSVNRAFLESKKIKFIIIFYEKDIEQARDVFQRLKAQDMKVKKVFKCTGMEIIKVV